LNHYVRFAVFACESLLKGVRLKTAGHHRTTGHLWNGWPLHNLTGHHKTVSGYHRKPWEL